MQRWQNGLADRMSVSISLDLEKNERRVRSSERADNQSKSFKIFIDCLNYRPAIGHRRSFDRSLHLAPRCAEPNLISQPDLFSSLKKWDLCLFLLSVVNGARLAKLIWLLISQWDRGQSRFQPWLSVMWWKKSSGKRHFDSLGHPLAEIGIPSWVSCFEWIE